MDILLKMYQQYKKKLKEGDLFKLQTMTMAFLAHAGLLRGSELINLKKDNFRWNKDMTKVEITIEVSKMTRAKLEKTEKIYLLDFSKLKDSKKYPATRYDRSHGLATQVLEEVGSRRTVGRKAHVSSRKLVRTIRQFTCPVLTLTPYIKMCRFATISSLK